MHYISLVKLVVPSEPPAWEHKGRQQRVSAPVKEVCGGWGGGGVHLGKSYTTRKILGRKRIIPNRGRLLQAAGSPGFTRINCL